MKPFRISISIYEQLYYALWRYNLPLIANDSIDLLEFLATGEIYYDPEMDSDCIDLLNQRLKTLFNG